MLAIVIILPINTLSQYIWLFFLDFLEVLFTFKYEREHFDLELIKSNKFLIYKNEL